MLRFAFRIAGAVIGLSLASSASAQGVTFGVEPAYSASTRPDAPAPHYVVGARVTLVATIPADVPQGTVSIAVLGASSVTLGTTTESLGMAYDTATPFRVLRASVLLDGRGTTTFALRKSSEPPLATLTLDALECDAAEFVLDPDMTSHRLEVGRVVLSEGSSVTLEVACLHDGEPVDDRGTLEVRKSGDDTATASHHRLNLYGYDPASFGTFEARMGETVVGALVVEHGSPEDVARVELRIGDWALGDDSMSLHARAYDASGDPVIVPSFQFTVDQKLESNGGPDEILLDVAENDPVVPICAWAGSRSDCIRLNAKPHRYPWHCASTSPTQLLAFWPLSLGILFARRVRRRIARALPRFASA